MPSQDCIFYLICNCFKSNWVCLPPFFLFASLFWFLNQGGGRPPPPRNVDEIRISYIAKSPYEISQNKTKFGRNYSYGTSSEWQLYHPEKICNKIVSFLQKKEEEKYLQIPLTFLYWHYIKTAFRISNYIHQIKTFIEHNISYEKYKISCKRRRNFL